MKNFDVKSLIAGIMIGTVGITTVYAASEIKSISLSDMKVTFNGSSFPLSKSLLSVTMENEQNTSLYGPINELFINLGYGVNHDIEKNVIDIIPCNNISHDQVDDFISVGNTVLNIVNDTDQRNIAESDSFRAENNQTLILNVTSDIRGGTVDLVLFDPNGKEQRIIVGSTNFTKEIAMEQGTWSYNCSGIFQDGGNIKIVGTIK